MNWITFKSDAFFILGTSDTVFLASISTWEFPISDDEVIVWDTAPINPGGHYNTILGANTAPVPGYYQ